MSFVVVVRYAGAVVLLWTTIYSRQNNLNEENERVNSYLTPKRVLARFGSLSLSCRKSLYAVCELTVESSMEQ